MPVILDESAYKFDELSRKYNHFYAPTVVIKVDGKNLTREQVPISAISVTSTTEAKADSFQFRIESGYDPTERKFDWLGSEIRVGKAITIQLGYVDKLVEVFDGYITGLTVDYPEDREPSVVVRGMDRSLFMMRGVHSKMWSESKVSDVVKAIAGANSLTADVDDTVIKKPVIEQMQTSDFLFVKQLAKDLNYEFFIVGKKLYFRKRRTSATSIITLSYGMNLRRFSLDVDISNQISKVTVRGFDQTAEAAVQASSQSVDKIGGNPRTGKDIIKSLTSRMEETIYSSSVTQGEAKSLADAVMNERSLDLVQGEGECVGIPELRAGRFIKLAGLGTAFDQPYVLKEVTHTLDDRGFFTTFHVEGNAINV